MTVFKKTTASQFTVKDSALIFSFFTRPAPLQLLRHCQLLFFVPWMQRDLACQAASLFSQHTSKRKKISSSLLPAEHCEYLDFSFLPTDTQVQHCWIFTHSSLSTPIPSFPVYFHTKLLNEGLTKLWPKYLRSFYRELHSSAKVVPFWQLHQAIYFT